MEEGGTLVTCQLLYTYLKGWATIQARNTGEETMHSKWNIHTGSPEPINLSLKSMLHKQWNQWCIEAIKITVAALVCQEIGNDHGFMARLLKQPSSVLANTQPYHVHSVDCSSPEHTQRIKTYQEPAPNYMPNCLLYKSECHVHHHDSWSGIKFHSK